MKGIMRLACCAALTLAAGCAPSKTSGPSASGDAVASADVSQDVSTPSTTYHGEARAILEQRCVSCHFEGGGAPFTLDWRADEWSEGPAWWTGIIMNAIEERQTQIADGLAAAEKGQQSLNDAKAEADGIIDEARKRRLLTCPPFRGCPNT